MQSEELFERAKAVSPGGVHSPVRSFKGLNRGPIFFKSASGCELTSVEGKTYTDYCMSFGPLVLGHRDPEVSAEVSKMIDTAWTFGACEPYSLALAEWIREHIPAAEKVRFVSSGTEAVMSAVRVARAATGRSRILKFEGCYHGHVDSLLVEAGSGLAGEAAASSAGIPAETARQTLVCPLGDLSRVEQIFAQHKDEIAAVIIEPLPANYGLLIQDEKFLRGLRDICKANGSLLILDEVISGFRVALGGMSEILGLKPDLVTYGKIIGGGFPVGCYAGRADLMDMVAPKGPVYQAGTLSANPVGMVAGLATLKKMKKLDGWRKLGEQSKAFADKVNQGLAAEKAPYRLLQYHSLFWLTSAEGPAPQRVDQIAKDQGARFGRIFEGLLAKNVYLAPNAYEVGFVSLAHTPAILSETADKLLQTIAETR